jgi:hypothetical protein
MSIHPDKTIDMKFIFLFIVAAYSSYLFHEFGHWIVGEILGNKMAYSLNYVWPRNGYYIHSSHDVYVSIGGPAFSILQSIFGLLIIEKYKEFSAYPFVFFPMFSRFFSLVFGGFTKQDEARISALLDAGTYTIAVFVVLILVLIVIKSSGTLKIDLKKNSYILTLCTLCQLLVIGTYELMSILKL